MHATIETIRERSSEHQDRVTGTQVRAVVDGLVAVDSLADVAATSGLTPTAVLDVVATFGTWLTHVKGGSGAATETAAHRERAGTRGDTVTIPDGFERTAGHRRDVSKALAAIVVTDPSDELITRYIARQYPTATNVLPFQAVSAMLYFATKDRLDEVDAIAPAFDPLAVAAYDLMETARADAVTGIGVLAGGDVTDLAALRDACTKARWVAEGELARIERAVTAAEQRPSAVPVLARELRLLAGRVDAHPDRYLPGTVADLTHGQVRRVAELAGLAVEATRRSDEADIRRRLQALGLSTDADRLVPDGIKAAHVGITDTFWDAMQRRADGEADWDDDLVEAFRTTTT